MRAAIAAWAARFSGVSSAAAIRAQASIATR